MTADRGGGRVPAGQQALYRSVADPGSLAAFGDEIETGDPAAWPGYAAQLRQARDASGARHAVTTALAKVAGQPCIIVGFEFSFLGGSMGMAEGAKIARAFAVAADQRLPVVTVAASGGMRMQEGTSALVQMHVAARAIAASRRLGIPHIAVASDPTTGGVWSSLVASADVIIGADGARVSFSGSRTRPGAADPDSVEFRSEGQWARGFVDSLAAAQEIRDRTATVIRLLSPRSRGSEQGAADGQAAVSPPGVSPPGVSPPGVSPPAEAAGGPPGQGPAAAYPAGAGRAGSGPAAACLAAAADASAPSPDGAPSPASAPSPDGWTQVTAARSPGRPRADAWLAAIFGVTFEIRGDRSGGVDSGLRCGFGACDGQTAGFIAQTGQPTSPAGFRTAARLVTLATRFRLPVLTLIDTPGAAAMPADEAAGVGPALAELLIAVAAAEVPVTSVIIGEGASGGALALASPASLWMTPDSYLAVAAPEHAAAILKQPASATQRVAGWLRLTPADLIARGLVRGLARAPLG